MTRKKRYPWKSFLIYTFFSSAKWFFRIKFYQELFILAKNVNYDKTFTKTQTDSYNLYQKHGHIDQKMFDNNEELFVLFNHKITKMGYEEVRRHYISPIFIQIEDLLTLKSKISVLEVGAGNCINLFLINEKFKDKVDLTGVDISPNRLTVAKEYFGDRLGDAKLIAEDITKLKLFDDKAFDLVYSVHCLEQVTYNGLKLIDEMLRLSNNKTTLIEPIYDLANPTQKLYMINSDHNRVILKDLQFLLKNSNYQDKHISYINTFFICSNPNNPSGIININSSY